MSVFYKPFWQGQHKLKVITITSAPTPLRLTIDCSDERGDYGSHFRSKSADYVSNSKPRIDVASFCNLIHNAIPKAVKDGKFILMEPDLDQTGYSDTQIPIAITPPNGFISKLGLSKLRVPKLRVPKITVPKLNKYTEGPYDSYMAPRIGSSMPFSAIIRDSGEASSAERMEVFKKGVQKMLHVVKVLGQIDQYLTERTRIIVDKLSKTFAE